MTEAIKSTPFSIKAAEELRAFSSQFEWKESPAVKELAEKILVQSLPAMGADIEFVRKGEQIVLHLNQEGEILKFKRFGHVDSSFLYNNPKVELENKGPQVSFRWSSIQDKNSADWVFLLTTAVACPFMIGLFGLVGSAAMTVFRDESTHALPFKFFFGGFIGAIGLPMLCMGARVVSNLAPTALQSGRVAAASAKAFASSCVNKTRSAAADIVKRTGETGRSILCCTKKRPALTSDIPTNPKLTNNQ